MAQVERQRENATASKRAKAAERRSRRASAAGSYELSSSAWLHVAALTQAFCDAGGALRIGYTRDGGALAIGCYLNDDYATEYIRPSENLEEAVSEIAAAWLPDGVTALQEGYTKIRAK